MSLTRNPINGVPVKGYIPAVNKDGVLRHRRPPVYHIADWCAVAGDGTTDDQPAIQAGIDAIRADQSGDVVIDFSPVTYKIGAGLKYPASVWLRGHSMQGGGTQFRMASTAPITDHLLSPAANDQSRVRIEGIRMIDDRTSASRTGCAINASRVVNGVIIKDVMVQNFYDGIRVGSDDVGNAGDVIWIENPWVANCLRDHIHIERTDNNVTVMHPSLGFNTPARCGVYIASSNTSVVTIVGGKIEAYDGATEPVFYIDTSNGAVTILGFADRYHDGSVHDTIYCSATSAPQRVQGIGVYRRGAGVLFNDVVLGETYSVTAGTHTPWVGSRSMHVGHGVYGSSLSNSSDYGTVTIRPRATDKRGLTIQGLSGQSVDHLRVMNDANTTLFRIASDGKAVAHQGIGVGNSVAATTLGTVTKKIQVYDASGASLGYVPVYDAIT